VGAPLSDRMRQRAVFCSAMKVLLITPPLLQLNTLYPATPVLAGFFALQGAEVAQVDLSLELALKLFSRKGLLKIVAQCRANKQNAPLVKRFLACHTAYLKTIDAAVSFLQGNAPHLAAPIAARSFLPEGPRLEAMTSGSGLSADEALEMFLSPLDLRDRAAFLASLYLDDLADVIREGVDPDFGFSRYAERLGVAMPTFDPLLKKLNAPPNLIAKMIDELAGQALRTHQPDVVGLTLPFPGTVYGAFRIAQQIRKLQPKTRILMGGGYVNTELRHLTDERVFQFVDDLCFDEAGEEVLKFGSSKVLKCAGAQSQMPLYEGIDFSRYINLMETTNPMHRIWSDGKWLKLQVANGCYWHKCAFCDVGLDYIGRYKAPKVDALVEQMEQMIRATGQSGFHFTDEALAPALLRQLSERLIQRKLKVTWWGNIRFEKAFTPELAQLMAQAGCIAVTGGLECAHDRLLMLMNKGITCAGAAAVCKAFSKAGILVHAYLMYGFPTQTRKEILEALEYVRGLFAKGYIQSAYWHRFALTIHSPIAKDPTAFGVKLSEDLLRYPAHGCKVLTRETLRQQPKSPRCFALNEISYTVARAPDYDRLGHALRCAIYNYMLGLGLEVPVGQWVEK
jgi:Radical SAM superfamily